MRAPTQAERQAVKAVDAYKGLDCGRFDPEKSDHVHGRRGAPALLFDSMKGVKVHGCEACVFGERYQHTCGCEVARKPVPEWFRGAYHEYLKTPEGRRCYPNAIFRDSEASC